MRIFRKELDRRLDKLSSVKINIDNSLKYFNQYHPSLSICTSALTEIETKIDKVYSFNIHTNPREIHWELYNLYDNVRDNFRLINDTISLFEHTKYYDYALTYIKNKLDITEYHILSISNEYNSINIETDSYKNYELFKNRVLQICESTIDRSFLFKYKNILYSVKAFTKQNNEIDLRLIRDIVIGGESVRKFDYTITDFTTDEVVAEGMDILGNTIEVKIPMNQLNI